MLALLNALWKRYVDICSFGVFKHTAFAHIHKFNNVSKCPFSSFRTERAKHVLQSLDIAHSLPILG